MIRSHLLGCGVALLLAVASTGCASPEWGGPSAPPAQRTGEVLTPETGADHPWSPGEDPYRWMHDRAVAGAEWIDPPGTTTPWPQHLSPQHGTPLEIDMPAASWTLLDGGADNALSIANVAASPWGYLYLGITVRTAGWAQLSDIDRRAGGTVTVAMTPAQWAFAVHTVDRDLQYYTGDDREQLAAARSVVTGTAAEVGVDLEPLAAELMELSTTTRSGSDAWDEALLAALESEQGW